MGEQHKTGEVSGVGATSGSTAISEERLNSIRKGKQDNTIESQIPKTRIPKVPSVLIDIALRDPKERQKYFEPLMVSIGPYHYGGEKLKPGEKLKLKLTRQFFSDPKQKQIEELHGKIFNEIKMLRACYEEAATEKYDDAALAWMLFVDGCSVLRYIQCDVDGKLDDLKIKNHELAFMHQDLFLLENQLPFLVLKMLMSPPVFPDSESMIETFILKNIKTPERKGWKQRWKGWKQQWQQRRQQRWQQQQQKEEERRQQRQQQQQQQKEEEERIEVRIEEERIKEEALIQKKEEPSHLLELLRTRMIGNKSSESVKNKGNKEESWQSFRDVTELREAGIHLKRSKSNFLNDVTFTSRFIFGYLKLPPMTVDDSTKPKFLNLIAYEMSPDFNNNFEVTSYVCFLDSLIDQPDDVKKLRKKGILHNFLGSDQEVATLFNEIATDLVPNPDIYKDVKVGIQRHYDDIGKKWMAEFVHSHFSSPWAFFAFLAAIAAFVLSIIPYLKK